MRVLTKVWFRWVVLVCALLMTSSLAWAGTVKIKDSASLLSNEDKAALYEQGARYPFDVRVLTTDSVASKNAFDQLVGDQVAAPNLVVVGVDPVHRHLSVHFGTGTHIPPSEFRAVEETGKPYFQKKDFRGGIVAILDQAARSVATAAPLAGPRDGSVTSANHGSGNWILLLVAGFVIAMVIWAIAARRRQASQQGYMPDASYGPGGYGPGGYGSPPYQGPGGYGPGPGGGSGLGAGLLGAGVGGLMGYELGKASAEAEHRSRIAGEDSRADLGGGFGESDFDAGGATSDWDDSGDGGGGGGDGDW